MKFTCIIMVFSASLIPILYVGAQEPAYNEALFNDAIQQMSHEGATEADITTGADVLRNLAAKGYGKALNEIGAFHANGTISAFPKDCGKAMEFFLKAWDAKELQAAQNIAVLYRMGDCFEPDTLKALEWTKKGAEAGFVGSMLDLGLYYLEPKYGQEIDSISALGWFRKAAELGNGPAMWQLSRFYHNKANAEEARYWLKKGCEVNDIYCLHGYGLCLKNGSDGIAQDVDLAAHYFKKAADMYGFEESQMEYANYCDTKGDYASAADYYHSAAEQGNILSIVHIADYHIAGKGGLIKDDKMAFEWYERGFNSHPRNGEEFAYGLYCYARMGLCYYLGKGVAQDTQKGRDILYQLAGQDFPTAIDYIRNLNIR